jgi:putative ABC transport system permease protein
MREPVGHLVLPEPRGQELAMFTHYLSTALRHFRQHKLTTGINVACLALGLTCCVLAWGTAAYYGKSDAYHAQAARTYLITAKKSSLNLTLQSTPWRLAEHLRAEFPELTVAHARFPQEAPVVAENTSGDLVSAFAEITYVDRNFLKVFDLQFIAGDARTALDQPRSLVVSDALARKMFGTTDVLGRTIRLAGGRYSAAITGVVAPVKEPSHMSTESASMYLLRFQAMLSEDMTLSGGRWTDGNSFTYVVLPADGSMPVDELNRKLEDFARRNLPPEANGTTLFRARAIGEFIETTFDVMAGADKTGVSSTTVLQALGLLVLLVACLNYANLATAQAATHAREVAMRRVVGANRRQVVMQHFMEALLLSSAGLLLALVCIALATLAIGIERLTVLLGLFVSMPAAWLFLPSLALAVSVVASLYPALVLSRVLPADALRVSRSRVGPKFVATLLVGLQFGAASFLMIGLFVVVSQNRHMQHEIVSADNPVVVIINDLQAAGVDAQVFRRQLAGTPGIASMSGIHRTPWAPGGNGYPLSPSPEPSAAPMSVSYSIVDLDFFETVGIPLLAGRSFERERASDLANVSAWHANDPAATPDYNIVVDRLTLQRMGLGDPDAAIGKVIYRPAASGGSPPLRLHIIGVVEVSLLMPMNLNFPTVYLLNPGAARVPLIRLAPGDVVASAAAIDSTWKALAPEVPLRRRFADEQFERSFQFLNIVGTALAGLAGFASFIAIIGLIGMALHVTRRRTHEIGIRKSLGAGVGQILWMLLRNLSKPIVIANLAVWPLVYLAMRGYLSLFAKSAGLSPVPFVFSLLVTLLVAWLAVIAQAAGAARLKPATVLRYE